MFSVPIEIKCCIFISFYLTVIFQRGLMKCDKQTVGGTCNFSCDGSYTL